MMFTTASRFFYTFAFIIFGGSVLYGWGARGGLNGVLSFGIDGGVGEHTGITVLVFTALMMVFLGSVTIAFRDATVEVSAGAQVDSLPEAPAPRSANYWPLIGAFGATALILGLVVSPQLFVFGVLVLLLVLIEWMVSSWADRATGDPEVNRRIRNRIMLPLEVPLFGAIGIIGSILGISRVLLAVSATAAWVLGLLVAMSVFGAAIIISRFPHAGRTLGRVFLALGAVAVLAGGIVGAAQGSREYHPEEHESQVHAPDRNQSLPGSAEESQAGH